MTDISRFPVGVSAAEVRAGLRRTETFLASQAENVDHRDTGRDPGHGVGRSRFICGRAGRRARLSDIFSEDRGLEADNASAWPEFLPFSCNVGPRLRDGRVRPLAFATRRLHGGNGSAGATNPQRRRHNDGGGEGRIRIHTASDTPTIAAGASARASAWFARPRARSDSETCPRNQESDWDSGRVAKKGRFSRPARRTAPRHGSCMMDC
jgi:hypothetical protein